MGPPTCAARFECVRGGHAHSSRGARRCRAPRPLEGCTEQRLLDGPDGAGLAGGARVTANPDLPSRHPGARERRLAAAVGAPAHGVLLRAGNRPADLAPSSYQQPARPPGRHPVPTDLRVPSRRPAHTPHRPHPGPALPAEPRTPPPRPSLAPHPPGRASHPTPPASHPLPRGGVRHCTGGGLQSLPDNVG